ncbi:unnamed protein product [Anisakis simplex]|uniref:Uncharacterized protein n=1 Tax=Anisakis simplex TaxID=6269 RepID=A0A3P6PMQ7_ANISI|nr:unnamed protein product [Anisakis simplex]
MDIRAQIGKIAAADVASGAKEFTLVGFLSNDHFAVLPSTSKMSAPEQSGATASVVAKTVPTSNPVGRPPKKKMSLDEYRKRKTTSCDKSEDNHHQLNSTIATTTASEQVSSSSTAAVTSKSVSSSSSTTPHSFIPTVNAAEVTRRTSLRLGALPDPSQLRALPTVSLDDLKERIYGKRVSAAASSSSSNAAASSSQASVTSVSPLPSVPTSSSAVGGSSFQSKTPFTRRFNAPTTITATPQTPPDSSSGIDMNQVRSEVFAMSILF